jgi:hypothetical protein
MSHRPPVFVIGLTVGDYLLWNWSLNGNHDVLALVSGLTLPPLAVACLWLLAMSVARLLARIPALRAMLGGRTKIDREHPQRSAAAGLSSDQSPTPNTPADRPARKLAA